MDKKDFSVGSVTRHILSLAVPMTVAQFVQIIYNIVDRIYIGNLPGADSMALTGLGLTFPIVAVVAAFTNLFGMGGAPLCSIARGQGNDNKAERIMGTTFSMLAVTSVVIMILCYVFMHNILCAFGASDASYPFAAKYLKIYLIGTPLIMIGTGMNAFINSQGFGTIGMITVLSGAVINIILDTVFIFGFKMGIEGAALATVISQLISCAWVICFLCGKKTILKLRLENLKIDFSLLGKIVGLGTASFIMSASTGLTQIVYNRTLKTNGGDIYVGIMAALNSVRDFVILPGLGLTQAAQPVIGYNLGAGKYDRIKQAIVFTSVVSAVYMLVTWLFLLIFPREIISIFGSNKEFLDLGAKALHIFFFGFVAMAFQAAGQSVFVGMGMSKHAIFFSLLRKVIIVIPLTFILPNFVSPAVNGVLLAEPVSNVVGGLACYITMIVTVNKIIKGENVPRT